MRKGGGKPKGGAFEHTIAKTISAAFKSAGIHEDDCYRSKNSGATKAQPGDLQFSPALAKFFPCTVECKHYKKINYSLGKRLDCQPKSYPILAWWKQTLKQQSPGKFVLLVMRQNRTQDLCCFDIASLRQITGSRVSLKDLRFFTYAILTKFKKTDLWIVPFIEFLEFYLKLPRTVGKTEQ